MTTIIVATSTKEQQDMIRYIREKLKLEYVTDTSVSIAQTNLTTICVYQSVKGMNHLAATWRVIIVPVSMSLDALAGLSPTVNININALLRKLDAMKAEAVAFVNSHKIKSPAERNSKEAFSKAVGRLFE